MHKKISGSRKGDFYGSQLAQDPVPLIYTNPLLSEGYGREHIQEAFFPDWGKGKCHDQCIHHQLQENLAGGPGAVPCIQIL